MNQEELKKFTINYINKKITENEQFIKYSFYELRIQNNLTDLEIDDLLKISRNHLENKGYNVYFTGAKFYYNGLNRVVADNELMIAIKLNEI